MANPTTTREPHAPLDWASLRPQVTDELLAGIVQRIVETFQPDKIVLFGSYAYGRPHVYSDIDLLVVMDSEEGMAKRSIPVYQAAKVAFLPLDLLVYTPKELEARLAVGDHFLKEILNKGRLLYPDEHA